MKIMFTNSMLIGAFLTAFAYATQDASSNPALKIVIQGIKNTTSADCTIERISAPRGESFQLRRPIEIPYISIRKYLREYASRRAYTPEGALKIATSQGLYRLWASESGVMYARDPKELASLDTWKAKTLLENDQQKRGTSYVTLVLAVLKNKFKISLEPARS
jgi:hypothetical protein